jgi:hypothetical protein
MFPIISNSNLAIAARLSLVIIILICFFEAPIIMLDLQGTLADCYGWRAMFRDSTAEQQRGISACVNFLTGINRNGIVAVSIKPDVAATGELSSIAFIIPTILVPIADIISVAIITLHKTLPPSSYSINSKTTFLFFESVASLLRIVAIIAVFIAIHASATLRKDMANSDAFVAINSQLGPGAYLIAISTLISFAIPPLYGTKKSQI